MQNITKMRIIHSVFKTPEVEYIKCFFNSIGLLISDEMIEKNNDSTKKLEKNNDSDGIDIVINYFGDDYNPNNNNRLYLYIDIENKICKIYQYPITFDENDMYVGEFFLTKPFEEYEKTQLSLVKNVSWLDINKLDGFALEAREILESNKLLSKDRIDKITEQIKLRIEFVKELIKTRETDNNYEI